MTTLLFARHGQASFGQRNYDKLSELGIKQAQLLGAHFAHTQRRVDAVLSGSLQRQQDTASHFLNVYNDQLTDQVDANIEIPHCTEPSLIEGLNEFNHREVLSKLDPSFNTEIGVLNAIANAPVPKLRLAKIFNDAMLRWHSGKHDADYQESWTQFNQRVQTALSDVMKYAKQNDAETVLVFTSGGVIASIAAGLLNQSNSNKSSLNDSASQDSLEEKSLEENSLNQNSLNPNSMMAYQINRSLINTGVTSIILKSDKPRLLSLNEHCHLYLDGKSYMTWQ